MNSPATSPTNIGILYLSRKKLEAHNQASSPLSMKVVGVLAIDETAPPDLIKTALSSIKVYGALIASPATKVALGPRLKVIGLSLEK